MNDSTYISSSYISLHDEFLSVPVPTNQFGLLMPAQDDEYDGCDTLEDIFEVCELHNLSSSLEEFKVIDENFVGTKPQTDSGAIIQGKEETVCKSRTATAHHSWRISLGIELEPTPASNANLPGWLVGTEHQKLYNMEALDGTGKRFELVYLSVGEPKASREKSNGKEKAVIKSKSENLKKKNKAQGTIPPPKPLQTSRTQSKLLDVRSTKEALINMGMDHNTTLMSDNLLQHFNKLSNVLVPVLSSGSGSNNAAKTRRKQVLTNVCTPTLAKQRRMSDVKKLKEDRVVSVGAGSAPPWIDENVSKPKITKKKNTQRRVSNRILQKSKFKEKTEDPGREQSKRS